jgi:membrane fusion protein, copper/silver efflux system
MTRALTVPLFLAIACGRDPPADHSQHDEQDVVPVAGHEGHEPPQTPEPPEGYSEVRIPADRQQLMGLKTARVEKRREGGEIRATAIVRTEESREVHVHSKLMGWIQKLYANTVGQQVKKGQPLYSIYSQDLFVAQQEYLRARQFHPTLAQAARDRMRLWDIPDDQIRRIEEEGPQKALIVRAPISGTVIRKDVLQGHYVEPEMMLYVIADLSRVWIVADVYEYEAPRVALKSTARVTVQGQTEAIQAAIDYVYPTVDTATRTVKIRLVADNRKGLLRPGNYATVLLPTGATEILAVPEEAVVDTGTRKVVYVALPGGRFRPVEVKVGRRAEGWAEILEGLEEGTEVVVSAQFLLDSESRLRGSETGAPAHEGH